MPFTKYNYLRNPSFFILSETTSAISFTVLSILDGLIVLVVPVQINLLGLTAYTAVSTK